MTEATPFELNPAQVSTLENLLSASFKFVSLEHVIRYVAVEKEGFVALLDPANGKLELYGQVGYRMGGGIGMLVERGGTKAFVLHSQQIEASPEMLEAYERVRKELEELIEGGRRVTTEWGTESVEY